MKKALAISSMLLASGIGVISANPALAQGGPKNQPWDFSDRVACSASMTEISLGDAYEDCEGMVTNPQNDVGSFPTLLDFLNGNLEDPNASGVFDPFDWLAGETWESAGDEIQNGTGVSGVFSSSTTSGSAAQSGDWSFDLDALGFSVKGLVLSVKASDGYSAYYFDGTGLEGEILGTWDTKGLENNGGQQPNISHISAYFVRGEETPEPEPVPEPAAMAGLMAIGAGIVINRRKKA